MKQRKIIGIDFTSAPTGKKPIICALAQLTAQDELRWELTIDGIVPLDSLQQFETFLDSCNSYHAGFDFPLGMPKELVHAMGWPAKWEAYVGAIAHLSKQTFCEKIENYSKNAAPGEKHLYRESDRLASACSPMMLYGVPVAKMFFEGATRLQKSNLSILPCRVTSADRIALETYPALVVRYLVGRKKYKASSIRQDDAQRISARREIMRLLASSEITNAYGITLNVPPQLTQQALQDHTGDTLDAICCCVQVGWAATHPTTGIPTNVAVNDGWIVDPITIQNRSV